MCRRNAVTHALLNNNAHTNLFLIQEPWFDTIGTTRNDSAHQGMDVLGGVASPGWEIIYPAIPKGLWPKVMTYSGLGKCCNVWQFWISCSVVLYSVEISLSITERK